MSYFRIRNSLEKKVIGNKFPQVKDALGDLNVDSPNYIGNMSFYLNKIDINPVLPELLLWESSKVTDLISSSFLGTGMGLITSSKLKLLVEKVTPQYLQFFTMKLHHKGRVHEDYWFLHPTKANNDLIDYNKSEIWEEKSLVRVRKREFQNFETFNEETKNIKYPNSLLITSCYLKKQLPDFFILNYIEGGVGYFVSESLKIEIEKKGCSGIVFTEPNERYP
jgi:hypothetical protein